MLAHMFYCTLWILPKFKLFQTKFENGFENRIQKKKRNKKKNSPSLFLARRPAFLSFPPLSLGPRFPFPLGLGAHRPNAPRLTSLAQPGPKPTRAGALSIPLVPELGSAPSRSLLPPRLVPGMPPMHSPCHKYRAAPRAASLSRSRVAAATLARHLDLTEKELTAAVLA